MTDETKDFLKAQGDKIILALLIGWFTVFMMVLLWRFPNLDAGTLQWIEKSVDMVTGALIAAVTTAGLMRRTGSTSETVTRDPGGNISTVKDAAGSVEVKS